jgi:hypothetical protein
MSAIAELHGLPSLDLDCEADRLSLIVELPANEVEPRAIKSKWMKDDRYLQDGFSSVAAMGQRHRRYD